MTFAAVLCCTAMLGFLSSCNKSVNPPTPDDYLAAEMTYQFKINTEIFSFFDVIVDYYDAEGEVKSEKMTQGSFEKKVKNEHIPCKLGMRVMLKVKDGIDLNTLPGFLVDYNYNCRGYCLDRDNYVVSDEAHAEYSLTFSVKEGKAAEWYDEIKHGLVNVLYEFKENKTFTPLLW